MAANIIEQFSQLDKRLANIKRMRDEVLEMMLAMTTKQTLRDILTNYLSRLSEGMISVEIVHCDPSYDEDSSRDEYRISVFYDTSDADLIINIVRRAFPHTVLVPQDEKPEGWHGCVVFDLVSKARFLSDEREIDSTVDEDNVLSAETYLRYRLRNDVPGTRARYPVPRHLKNGDWAAVAEHQYQLNQRNRNQAQAEYNAWYNEYRRALWCNLQGRLLNLSIALAPLRQVPYTLLWILDLIRPMSFRYWKDGRPYDPNHLRKLRLFERVSNVYETANIARSIDIASCAATPSS